MENRKMCNILKTACRREKWVKIWDSQSQELYMQHTHFQVRPFQFSLGYSVHFAKFPMLKFSKTTAHSFHPISTKPYRKPCIRGKYRLLLFLANCQILKVHGTLKISYLSYIASIHKAMLVSAPGKKSPAEYKGPWVSC